MKKAEKPKLIKDIVHGYIELESKYIKLIDTPEFQRIKNIRQTSYTALYPSSSHDRFSHSLGVFALGKYAFDHLQKNVINDYPSCKRSLNKQFWDQAREVFLSACLLHDVGHAPFSHTSEDFFKIPVAENETKIYHYLQKAVNKPSFAKDYPPSMQDKPKAHEIMSATIGIELLKNNGFSVDNELFARMIIGIPYSSTPEFKYNVYNALVGLLNSDIIDVDRLDYIMRDALTAGYKSVSIDINRLLSSVCLITIPPDETKYALGFYKNAISIIENVIIAHDLERRWVQNHSAIAYDTILIQHCIKEIESSLTRINENGQIQPDTNLEAEDIVKSLPKNDSIFRQEALSPKGIQIDNNNGFMHKCKIRLLSDSDILFLAKQIPEDNKNRDMIDEYFDRRIRKKAIWKTEMDFSNLMRNLGEETKDKFLYSMMHLFSLLCNLKTNNATADFLVINENSKAIIAEEFDKKRSVENLPENQKSKFDDAQSQRESAVNIFEEICAKCNIKFNLVIKRFKKFSSGTDKLDKKDIYIKFNKKNNVGTLFNDLVDTYRLKKENEKRPKNVFDDDVYYVYYKRNEKDVDPMTFIKAVLRCYNLHKNELGSLDLAT